MRKMILERISRSKRWENSWKMLESFSDRKSLSKLPRHNAIDCLWIWVVDRNSWSPHTYLEKCAHDIVYLVVWWFCDAVLYFFRLSSESGQNIFSFLDKFQFHKISKRFKRFPNDMEHKCYYRSATTTKTKNYWIWLMNHLSVQNGENGDVFSFNMNYYVKMSIKLQWNIFILTSLHCVCLNLKYSSSAHWSKHSE